MLLFVCFFALGSYRRARNFCVLIFKGKAPMKLWAGFFSSCDSALLALCCSGRVFFLVRFGIAHFLPSVLRLNCMNEPLLRRVGVA